MEAQKDANKTKEKKPSSKKRVFLVIAFLILVLAFMGIKLRGDYLNIQEIGENYLDIFQRNLQYSNLVLVVNFIIIFVATYITTRFIKKGLKVFFQEEKRKCRNYQTNLYLSFWQL